MIAAQAIDPSLAGVITAIVGGIVGIGGLFLNLVGKKDQTRQQIAADAAAEDKVKLDRTEQALDAVQRRAELAEAGERALREENQRLRAENNTLDEQLDTQRRAHRREFAQQESRCREQLDAVTDTVITLRNVVNDEVAQAAARTVLDRVLPHPHDPPVELNAGEDDDR